MNVPRTLAATALALAVGASAFLNAPVAHATSANGCTYPYVCIYDIDADATPSKFTSSHIVGRFRDVTSAYQNVVNRKVWTVLNTRNDDTVYLRMVSGFTHCMGPNNAVSSSMIAAAYGDGAVLDKLRISSSASC